MALRDWKGQRWGNAFSAPAPPAHLRVPAVSASNAQLRGEEGQTTAEGASEACRAAAGRAHCTEHSQIGVIVGCMASSHPSNFRFTGPSMAFMHQSPRVNLFARPALMTSFASVW